MCGRCLVERSPIAEEVRRYDKDLEIRFNQERGRFEVWKWIRRLGRSLRQFTIQNEDGSFRPLDRRVIHDLAARDPHRIFASGWDLEIDRTLREKDAEIEDAADRRFSDSHREGGERLYKAFKQDGIFKEFAGPHDRKKVTVPFVR